MKIKNFEKGQTIVLIALSMIGLIAMAALIIDGSNAYLNRRRAQTAADAAALAGAREYCISKNPTNVDNVVKEYAMIQNHATAVLESFLDADNIINVTVELTAPTFFAKVFNTPESTVVAKAAAGCYNPAGGKGVLPVAWYCKDPLGQEQWDSPDCKYKALDYETELVPLINGGYPADIFDLHPDLYIIIDSESLPDGAEGTCISEGGTMQCDFDQDGRDDFLGNGDSTWLDLDGAVKCGTPYDGTKALDVWITDGYGCELQFHTWIPSEPGAPTAAFGSAADKIAAATTIVGRIFVIPIFNQFCAAGEPYNDPSDPDWDEIQLCLEAAHEHVPLPPEMAEDIVVVGTANTYYHIVGFAFFYISCIDSPPYGPCPGHEWASDPARGNIIKDNVKTIEGFFVTNVPIDFGASGSGGIDTGAYVLSLTQ